MTDAADSANWIDFCAEEDIPAGGNRAADLTMEKVVIFRTLEGRLFAVANRCPHFGAPLSAGRLEGECVTCAFHGWQVALADGEVLPPNQGHVKRYPVRVEAGRILLGIDEA